MQPGYKNLLSRHLGWRRWGLAAALQSSLNLPHLPDDEKCPTKRIKNCGSVWALEKGDSVCLVAQPQSDTEIRGGCESLDVSAGN